MQPSIPPGTLLQNRYRLVKVLGQGGFGRTYLAEDQARFNERCVVKEYIPMQGDTYALEKSKELFQRESAILYQIQHPQIPQFRANFEQGRRLFFVQDYADGKTYSTLLEDRLEQNQTFSEQEVLHLLEQMLPVLTYIHGKGLIHRDISPDNLILRESDRLPVLIDFGVVKTIAGQIQSGGEAPEGTTVGKLGFAPNEQLQTGKAYPNSDLYALAVTAVVLMTGQRPQDLLDENTLTWNWLHRVPTLSPLLAQVINRMLSPKPNNRYQSAIEVSQALRSLTGLVPPSTAPISDPTQLKPQVRTSAKSKMSTSQVVVATEPSFWQRPWVGKAIVISIGIAIALSPFVLMASLLRLNSTRTVTTPIPQSTIVIDPDGSPSTVTSAPATTAVTASPSTAAVSYSAESLNLTPEQSTIQASGRTSPQQVKRYIVRVYVGQTIAVDVVKGAVSLNISDEANQPIANGAGVSAWRSEPATEGRNYQIDVIGALETDFTLSVSVQTADNPLGTPSPSPSPLSSPSPILENRPTIDTPVSPSPSN